MVVGVAFEVLDQAEYNRRYTELLSRFDTIMTKIGSFRYHHNKSRVRRCELAEYIKILDQGNLIFSFDTD